MSQVDGIRAVARLAAQEFVTASRSDGSRYVKTRDGAPEWVGELVRSAHGEFFLPDDWRYASIASALECIVDAPDGSEVGDLSSEWADGNVDTYNGERLAWLASHLTRPGYCDEAAGELGWSIEGDSIMGLIGLGQFQESLEVFGLVVDALERHAGEFGDLFEV